jgi:L-threonylcarbamoyladenylate synthase
VRRIGLDALLGSEAERSALAAALRAGGLAALPTETFYGLAADPRSGPGVRRALAMKRRGDEKPLPVLFGAREQLAGLGVAAPAETLDRFFGIWPAPLTVVLPLSRPIPASLGGATLAVRVPAHAGLRALLRAVGPVTGSSLNRTGEPPCESADAIERLFAGEIDVLVDGGPSPGGLPTTLVDATSDPPRVLRQGAFAWPPASA